MLHDDNMMGRLISISYRLDDPNYAAVIAFIL